MEALIMKLHLLDKNKRISLVPQLSHFMVKNEFFFIKLENKLFKISATADFEKQLKIFTILQKPRKLNEIIDSLPNFRKKDILDFLEQLYSLKFIRIEDEIDEGSLKTQTNSINANPDSNYDDELNSQKISKSPVLVTGDGILSKKLHEYLKNIGIQCSKESPSLETSITRYAAKSKNTPSDHEHNSPTSIPNVDKFALIIGAQDYQNISFFEAINRIAMQKKIPWIRVSFDDNIGYLGPFVIPGKTACYNCCELRLVTNSPDYEYQLWNYKEFVPSAKLMVSEVFVDILAAMCANEVIRYLMQNEPPLTTDSLHLLDTRNSSLSKHKVISHPNCNYGCLLHEKERPQFIIQKNGTNKWEKNKTHELNSIVTLEDLLERLADLTDERTGIIRKTEKLYENNPLGIRSHHFFAASCSKPIRIGPNGHSPLGTNHNLIAPFPSGSGYSPAEAEIRTLMESIERYSNMVVDESRLKWSTYREIKSRAISPADLGLYTDLQYQKENFKCSRFSPESVIPWIEGQDLFSGKVVLIPADFVFYPALREKPLVIETSNGAAAHTNIVDAILNGLFEVIERDAFLIMWLNRLAMPILDAKYPIGFQESINLINKFGMEIRLVDLTNDTNIPTVMAVCYNRNPNKYPALVVGTGSHIDPERAIQKALFEMEFLLIEFLESPVKNKITSPDQISSIFEHPHFYLNPRMRKYWEFMIQSKKKSILPKLKKEYKDNYLLLKEIVGRLNKMKHRVVYVDVTSSDIERAGLVTAKVFVTGMQPMYIRNEFRLCLDRLAKVPLRLGYTRSTSIDISKLNSAPHPLP
jgi:ribosomal protein S12 methylthiotransferase accessory factor